LAAEEKDRTEINEKNAPTKSVSRSQTGFNKRLLKSASGEEQSFEEARASAKYYKIAAPSTNFNLLHVERVEQGTSMDLDEETSIDVSMAESLATSSHRTTASKQPRKLQRLNSNGEGRVLFRTEASFDTSLNQTAISNASSTLHTFDAVGVPTKKEEETINTKLAMKELSMMFSSPAFGVDDVARKTERATARLNQSITDERHQDADVSYGNVGDMLGNSMLDNSILNVQETDDENSGMVRNPFARTTSTPGFEKMAFRELEGESDAGGLLGCRTQSRQPPQRAIQENPLRGPEVELSEDADFKIFEEDQEEPNSQESVEPPQALGFTIFQDEGQEENKEDNDPLSGGLGFSIYEDGNAFEHTRAEDSPSAKGSEESGSDLNDESGYEHGDTASISLFGDAVAWLDDERKVPASRPRSGSGNADADEDGNSVGDTATVSLFNEIFQEVSQTPIRSAETRQSSSTKSGGFEIFVEGDQEVS
jgi:hypothetical protein